MRTFLFSPLPEKDSMIEEARNGTRLALADNPPLRDGLKKIHSILKKYLQFDYIVLTYATEYPDEEQYFLFPEVEGARPVFLNSCKEQLLVLRSGPKKIVRIGCDEDHGITPRLINGLFPDTPFSLLLLRSISRTLICGCSFVSMCKTKQFDNWHASLAFALFDLLIGYFRRRKPKVNKGKTRENFCEYLSITDLPGMKDVTNMLWRVARQQSPVLLLGESGTGKELVAETLFRASARVNGPFIKVNCGGIPDTLIDSELFGHEKGSFTGAEKTRKGIFERAHRGILLLDEIGELPAQAQTRLLRILQDGILERVGGSEKQRLDIKIIAATHRDLKQMVMEGRFRADLFFRLNVFPIFLPPLRDRPEDIPLLINFFIARKCREYWVREAPVPSPQNMEQLLSYAWPGNIRELSNAVERAFTLWLGDMRESFAISIDEHFAASAVNPAPVMPERMAEESGKPAALDAAIRRHIQQALAWCGGKINGPGGAAEILDINPSTLRAKMRKLGL